MVNTVNELLEVLGSKKEVQLNEQNVVVWGAGRNGILLNSYLKPKYYIDSNVKIHGDKIGEAKIISPDEFYEIYVDEKIYVSPDMYFVEIKNSLIENGIDSSKILSKKDIGENIVNFAYIDLVIENEDKINKVFNVLADDESKMAFLNTIYFRAIGQENVDDAIICKHREYFDNDVFGYPGDYFVDGGANIGQNSSNDYVKKYKDCYKKLYAFEPTENIFTELKENLKNEDTNKVELYQIGLVDKKGTLTFNSGKDHQGNRVSEVGNITIEVNSLDNILMDKPVDFIKMDIEGSELKALEGAKNIISKQKPKLAICTYHSDIDVTYCSHFWEVPFKILELNPNYKLYIRHHSKNLFDTICYAVDENK